MQSKLISNSLPSAFAYFFSYAMYYLLYDIVYSFDLDFSNCYIVCLIGVVFDAGYYAFDYKIDIWNLQKKHGDIGKISCCIYEISRYFVEYVASAFAYLM